MNTLARRKDGFEGEKIITLPQHLHENILNHHYPLFPLYVTQLGYFPNANGHFRERPYGCQDNILIYCLKGKGGYVIGDKCFEVNANQFFILPATDESIRYWSDPELPWTIYWVHFTGPSITKFNHSLNLNSQRGPQRITLNAKAIDLWHTMYQSLEDGYTFDNLCNTNFCLHNFIATFLFPDKHEDSEEKHDKNLVGVTIKYMHANLNKKITVEEMASRQNLSSSRFSNLFRKATGMPPNDYFIYLRMQKACELLDEQEARIKCVAGCLGYDDPYYFSRLFKKHIGVSPEKYRISSRTASYNPALRIAVG